MYKRQLHGEVLDFFIPRRRRDQLRFRLFYRVQANGEELADFVHDIRKAARILRLGLGLPERDIIQAILEGLNPQERSRLIFADRPRLRIWTGCVWFLELSRRGTSPGEELPEVTHTQGVH